MKNYDIAVIGGGASGLAAAISAKRTDKTLDVALLERLPRVGKKILSTGNGRCNFTNREISESCYFGSCRDLYILCGQYPAEEFFASLGVLPVADECGRVYPNSGAASSVLDALRLEAQALGIAAVCGFDVKKVENGFIIRSGEDAVKAKRVIFAGGGRSQPSLGSNGSVLGICRDMGMEVSRLFPALTPLKTDAELVSPLKGQRVPARAAAYINGKEAASDTGEVQFGDGVISGICIFDLSCIGGIEKAEVVLDLLPDKSVEEVYGLFSDIREKRIDAALEDCLSGVFNKRVAMYIIKQCVNVPLTSPASALTADDVRRIAERAKALPFPVRGTAGFERSQVTGGGIVRGEIGDDLQSKKINGLYLCGEMLDIHGKCGGYNLAFAFASGQHAGRSCALS